MHFVSKDIQVRFQLDPVLHQVLVVDDLEVTVSVKPLRSHLTASQMVNDTLV